MYLLIYLFICLLVDIFPKFLFFRLIIYLFIFTYFFELNFIQLSTSPICNFIHFIY